MKKLITIIDEWGLRIITLLVLIIFLRSCSTTSKITKVQKELKETNKQIETLSSDLKKQIQIEGLKSEKRMIQSTNRRILDVNRQTEIDNEISNLQK